MHPGTRVAIALLDRVSPLAGLALLLLVVAVAAGWLVAMGSPLLAPPAEGPLLAPFRWQPAGAVGLA